jgi:hypothetical protein
VPVIGPTAPNSPSDSHYLYSTGWTLGRTIEHHIRPHLDDRMFDLCFFRQTREAWRACKKAKLEGGKSKASPEPK